MTQTRGTGGARSRRREATRRLDIGDGVMDRRRVALAVEGGGTDAERAAWRRTERAAQRAVGRQMARGKLTHNEAARVLAMLGIFRRIPNDEGDHDCH